MSSLPCRRWLVVLVLIVVLTLIALRGIAESARVAAVLTLIEVGGLLWVIAVASPNVANLAMRCRWPIRYR